MHSLRSFSKWKYQFSCSLHRYMFFKKLKYHFFILHQNIVRETPLWSVWKYKIRSFMKLLMSNISHDIIREITCKTTDNIATFSLELLKRFRYFFYNFNWKNDLSRGWRSECFQAISTMLQRYTINIIKWKLFSAYKRRFFLSLHLTNTQILHWCQTD